MRSELLATALGMRTRVGEPVKGELERDGDVRHVHVFRAMVEHVRKDDEDPSVEEASLAYRMGNNFFESGEGATDPFKEPAASQIARIERTVSGLARTEYSIKMAMRTTGVHSDKV